MHKIGPREKQNRFSRGPIFIACFEFLMQIALAVSFCAPSFSQGGRATPQEKTIRTDGCLDASGGAKVRYGKGKKGLRRLGNSQFSTEDGFLRFHHGIVEKKRGAFWQKSAPHAGLSKKVRIRLSTILEFSTVENFETVIFSTKDAPFRENPERGINRMGTRFSARFIRRFSALFHSVGERMWKNKNPYEQKRCWPITVMTGREKIHWFVDLAGL